MKKISLVILTILLCFVALSFAVCPAPFEKAKAIALKAERDLLGRHLVDITINRNGEEIIYIIGYLPRIGIIGIGKLQENKFIMFEYNEESGEYTVWVNGSRNPIDSKLCTSEAFKIFREMVGGQLI